jgi:hypothetical protein
MLRSVVREDVLLSEAWRLPSAKRYLPLLSQNALSICGPTSAGNVLKSMGADRGRNPFSRFGLRAMSLDQLARESAEVVPAGWRVDVVRLRDGEHLRDELRKSNDERFRYIANFSRRPIFGHGGGHHSPVGGYLERDDLAFVLDVNASYGPWLVETEKLFDALNTTDRGDGRSRGLVRFAR